jgi:hypothetical protein
MLVTVTDCVALLAPTGTSPKSNDVGLRANNVEGGAPLYALPVKLRSNGCPFMKPVADPVCGPVAVGANVQ